MFGMGRELDKTYTFADTTMHAIFLYVLYFCTYAIIDMNMYCESRYDWPQPNSELSIRAPVIDRIRRKPPCQNSKLRTENKSKSTRLLANRKKPANVTEADQTPSLLSHSGQLQL
ncbi:hypothetical protein BDW74DRAFT_71282 [Aspergillus multicolor]|uniref:uncharacterized protein n=1 Tax=Aspergillus multicolor TaxID=41759 RepID=UPI003CCDB2AE